MQYLHGGHGGVVAIFNSLLYRSGHLTTEVYYRREIVGKGWFVVISKFCCAVQKAGVVRSQ